MHSMNKGLLMSVVFALVIGFITAVMWSIFAIQDPRAYVGLGFITGIAFTFTRAWKES